MRKFIVMMLFLLFVSMGMLGTASAVPILDFGVTEPTTGSLSYDNGADPLVCADISVDNVALKPFYKKIKKEIKRKPSNNRGNVNTPAPVPEPATMLLLGSGIIGLVSFGRKKFAKKA